MKRFSVARPTLRSTTTLTICMLVLWIAASASAQTHYRVVDLTFPGGDRSFASAINNLGQVTGCSDGAQTGGSFHAFLFTRGKLKDIGVPTGANNSCGSAINAFGHVVGNGTDANGAPVSAFLFRDRKLTVLDIPVGSEPLGVNIFDQIVGVETPAQLAFLFSHGKFTEIGTLPGDLFSQANGINNFGQITGFSRQSLSGHFTNFRGFLFRQGIFTFIGTLPNGEQSEGDAINDFGQITGRANYAPFPTIFPSHAIIYSHGVLRDLGTLPGGRDSQGTAINNRGQVVGNSDLGPFLFDGKQMIALNSLLPSNSGWTLNSASGINDRGEIVGDGTINGAPHAYLLSPVRYDDGQRRKEH